MSWRKFPIRIYQKQDGTIYYDAKFMNGTAKTIQSAFAELSRRDLNWELVYYYDDVMDVQLGAFIPALQDKKYKGMLYLGKIELSLYIDKDWDKSTHSVSHLARHPQDIKAQEEFIDKLQKAAKREQFIKSIKNGLKKLVNIFKPDTFVIDEYLELLNKAEE